MIVRTDTEAALLAAIAKNPDEDDPRLRYSDWLEENGNPERAEFIRVQCELSRYNTCPFTPMNTADLRHPRSNERHMYECPPKVKEPCGWCPVCKNKERENALLAEHRREWLRVRCSECGGSGTYVWPSEDGGSPVMKCPACDGSRDIGRLAQLMRPGDSRSKDPYHFPTTFSRGFPLSVTARLADVFERPRYNPGHDTEAHGPWQPTVLALRWVRHHPTIRRVILSDFTPLHHTGSLRAGYGYVGGEHGPTTPYALPNILLWEVGWDGSEPTDHSHGYLVWKTAQEVKDRVAKTAADVIRTHLEKESVQ